MIKQINRARLKANARAKVQDKTNGIMQVTVRYLLATSWVSAILRSTVTSPTTRISNAFYETGSKLAEEALSSGVTNPDLSPAYMAAWQVIQDIIASPAQQTLLFGFLVLTLYMEVARFGYRSYCLRTHQGEELGWQSIFDVLWMAGRILMLYVVTMALVFSGLFFLVLPGLYIYYGLRFAPYVMMEHEDWGVFRCMMESWQMSFGYKMRLLVLDLSFIFWEMGVAAVSELGFRMGGGLPDVFATVFSLALTTSVLAIYLPYKELTLIGYYEIIKAGKKST